MLRDGSCCLDIHMQRSNNGYSRINQSFIVWEGRQAGAHSIVGAGERWTHAPPAGAGGPRTGTGYSNGTESAPSPVTDLQNLFSPLAGPPHWHCTPSRRQPPAPPTSYFGNDASQLIYTDLLSTWKKLKIWNWDPYYFLKFGLLNSYWSLRWSEIV